MTVITGKCKWASISAPNTTYEPAWQIDVSLDDVIAQNITKLAARYPEGTFSSYFSENRRIDDL